ncbi:MAG: PBP1A family penicillin-binding protein [Eubacterium sp.]|nr:PBP1A family penicillin-binding protein [Eubacterium sp.]
MKKTKKKKAHRGFWIFIKIQIFLMLLVAAAVGYYYIGGYAETIAALHEDALEKVYGEGEEVFRDNETSVVYDADGEVISTLVGEQDKYYLTYENIPSYVYCAFVSVEDKKFYKHGGVDLEAIVRAAWAAVRNGEVTQGGSTITQQLAKNVYLTSERTWERKVEEIFIALELERIYSKEKILEFYVNNCYFANGNYGIEAAAQSYFNCSVNSLSLSQVAFLCAIPNNPTLYDPLTNYDNTISRRDRVLAAMVEEGYISQTDYAKAIAEEIVLDIPETEKNDYAETYTYYCAIRALMENDGFEIRTEFKDEADEAAYTEEYEELYNEYQLKLYSKGYRIYTSLDLDVQSDLQKSVNRTLKGYTSKTKDGIYKLQGSAVTIDNITGYVIAIVGGRKQNTTGYTLNRAYQSFRQPGSSIKPLIVYTPAFENGYTPNSKVVDEEIEDGPENSDGTYMGKISIRTAVSLSRNTVAWKLFEELTPEVGLSYLKEMNFSHIDKEDYRLTSALGGFTDGVSALEMTSAYATLANDGKYREPTCILKICDSQGETILETSMEEHQIYETNASRMMTSVLQTVLKKGTGKGLALEDIDCAGKTGTTNNNKDGWFVGYSYYFTTGVWVGYDTPKKLPTLSGATYPGQIWNTFMEKLHEGYANVKFKDYISYEDEEEEEEEKDITIYFDNDDEDEDETSQDTGQSGEEEEDDNESDESGDN